MKPLLFSFVLIPLVLSWAINISSLAKGPKSPDNEKSKESSPPARNQQERQPNNQTTETKSHPAEPTKPPVSEPQSDHNTETATEKPKDADDWFWKLFWEINWSGWGQVIVGGVGLYIIWRTLKAVEEQASATEKAANAALITAQSVVTSERAYVFARVDEQWNLNPSPSDPEPCTTVQIKFINYGKTPAVIRMMRGQLILHTTAPDKIPPEAQMEHWAEGYTIAQGQTHKFRVHFPLPKESIRQALEGGTVGLFCVGQIYYRDVFGNFGETGFCWAFLKGRPRFCFISNSPLNYCK